MEHRATPVRKPHTNTADLLSWPENPSADSSAVSSAPRPVRNVQPSDGISKVVFGGQVTDEEVESLMKRKPCSEHKLKEITGSGIFTAQQESDEREIEGPNATPSNKTGLRMYQQTLTGMSQISFGAEESLSPKKPTTIPEVAKQRELSGTLVDTSSEAKLKKQLSDAKTKELSGHDIFAPPPEIQPPAVPLRSPAFQETDSSEVVAKTAKKIPGQKFAHLSGNNIFKEEEEPPKSAEKPLSHAKLREMSGSNIFADGKVEKSRDYYSTGVRKPPGGESSIALV